MSPSIIENVTTNAFRSFYTALNNSNEHTSGYATIHIENFD
jgi:hypothetical protein